MISLLRVLAALVFALCLALPGIGGDGDGGENGGGTGVWVLPRAGFLTPPATGAPRATLSISVNQDCLLQLSPEMGAATGTFVDDVSGSPVSLGISGSTARIPCALLQSLANMTVRTATVLVSDAAQLGYVIEITVHMDGTATLHVL
jgi:hypothetical protein